MTTDTSAGIHSNVSIPLPARKTAPRVSITMDDEQPDVVATVKAEKQAERDPNYVSVDLPSKFYFYSGLKSLSVGTVRGAHQAKFAKASKLESTKLTVEAITSLLGDGVSAQYLTVPDFFWLMYYLRLNFYPEGTLNYQAVCTDQKHLSDVRDGIKTQESLLTVSIVKKTDLRETLLSDDAIREMESIDQTFVNELGYKLTAPRMMDSIDLEDNFAGREDYDELEFLADYAGCLSRLDGEVVTLEDRIKVVSNLTPFQLKEIDRFHQAATSYGVEEFVKTTCKECGAVVETEVSVTAHDFL